MPNGRRSKPSVYYARDQRSYTGPMKFNVFNTAPEARDVFPCSVSKASLTCAKATRPITSTNKEERELEGVGVVASAYETH